MSDCIEWGGYRNSKGYGLRDIGGKTTRVHRAAWEAAHGPIPEGMCVLHRCDNPPCHNVDHLFLGTKADNNADMVAKNRHAAPRGESHGNAKLTDDIVREIRASFDSGHKLAARYGVSHPTIRSVLRRRTWAHVTDLPLFPKRRSQG